MTLFIVPMANLHFLVEKVCECGCLHGDIGVNVELERGFPKNKRWCPIRDGARKVETLYVEILLSP